MKRMIMLFILGGFVFIAFSGFSLMAQNAVVNPLFQTQDMIFWTGDDPTLMVVPGDAKLGLDSYCVRKYPGGPDNNGAITQQVHLIGGITYNFRANIASKYCST